MKISIKREKDFTTHRTLFILRHTNSCLDGTLLGFDYPEAVASLAEINARRESLNLLPLEA